MPDSSRSEPSAPASHRFATRYVTDQGRGDGGEPWPFDDEFGLCMDPCEHPSINGGICAACGEDYSPAVDEAMEEIAIAQACEPTEDYESEEGIRLFFERLRNGWSVDRAGRMRPPKGWPFGEATDG